MPTSLYPHNQKAYEQAVSLLNKTGKAAIIHPTGSGKSFVAFKLAEEHPEACVCWLSPSSYIYKTQLENLKAVANGYEPQNICFMTYAKLMMTDETEIGALRPDYIVLDEFHRCGALEWGKGVKRLLAAYPAVPLLGLSATNVRYLDNQRNMADELFDGNIASEMTLGEAIVKNILLPPLYITSIYSYRKDLEKYQKRVNKAKNSGVRDAAQKYLDALKRALIQADGLDVIFDKHMKDRCGKYMVFCANVEHMNEMIERVPEWFGKIDRTPHIYSVYSQGAESENELTAFKDDNSDRLKLLFSIDMLNEGIHVEDISGVILLRPTISPIIYKQQIGRALSASKGKNPIIFDIVNNFENLYSINAIESEMHETIKYLRETNDEHDIINSKFKIIDEVSDFRHIFNELQDTLSASWDMMFDEAKKYYDAHGSLLVPYHYKANHLSLGMWIKTQRMVKKGTEPGKLTEERIEKLDSIGMVWEGVAEFNWNRKYGAAKAYYEAHGDLNVLHSYIAPDGFELGKWIANLRSSVKGKQTPLSKQHIRQLDEIGMIWNKEEYRWELNFKAAKQFYEENGHLAVPTEYIASDGVALGTWIKRMRGIYFRKAQGRLSRAQIERLNAIDMIWAENYSDYKWEQGYAAAQAYFEKHGCLDVSVRYKSEDGFELGRWLGTQRALKKNADSDNSRNKLSHERISRLNRIGMAWDKSAKIVMQAKEPKPSRWETNYAKAREYFEKHGDLNVKFDYVTEDGVKLGAWLGELRSLHKSSDPALTEKQICLLDEIKMIWDLADKKWEENYEKAKLFFREHGHLGVPNLYKTPDGFCLGSWVSRQRGVYNGKVKDGKLSQPQIERLNSIGMVWKNNKLANHKWELNYARAKEFYQKYGHLGVPVEYVTEDGFRLGYWIYSHKYALHHPNKRKSSMKLTSERVERLNAIGMVWGKAEAVDKTALPVRRAKNDDDRRVTRGL